MEKFGIWLAFASICAGLGSTMIPPDFLSPPNRLLLSSVLFGVPFVVPVFMKTNSWLRWGLIIFSISYLLVAIHFNVRYRRVFSKKPPSTNLIINESPTKKINQMEMDLHKTIIIEINNRMKNAIPIMVRLHNSQNEKGINESGEDADDWFRESTMYLAVNLGDKYTTRMLNVKGGHKKFEGANPGAVSIMNLTASRVDELEKIRDEILSKYK